MLQHFKSQLSQGYYCQNFAGRLLPRAFLRVAKNTLAHSHNAYIQLYLDARLLGWSTTPVFRNMTLEGKAKDNRYITKMGEGKREWTF